MARMRTQQENPDGWRRVAEAMRGRAIELGWNLTRLQREADISETTRLALEAGKPLRKPEKIASICKALGWEPGSVDAILAGGEPTVVEEMPPADEIRQRLQRIEELVQLLMQGQDRGVETVLARIDERMPAVRPARRRAAQ